MILDVGGILALARGGARARAAPARALHEGEEACRLGGDEFGLILPGAQAEYAALVTGHVLDRLRTVEDTSGAPLRAEWCATPGPFARALA